MKAMTKLDAVRQIIRSARLEKVYLDEYKRTRRALFQLLDKLEDIEFVLCWLDYHDADGNPYPALQKLLDKEQEKKNARREKDSAVR